MAYDLAADPDADLRLLSIADAARCLGCSIATIRRRIAEGELPVVRFSHKDVKVRASDLRAYIEAHTVTVAS